MIEIGRHIVPLLFSNDCVIIPDFGGFIVHHTDAMYDESANIFYPPIKTLGFNPQLKINDSVLAQSYAETYDISFPEATRRLEQEVREMISSIQEAGFYELEDLGMLRLNEEGNYEFEPCEAGILTPMLYGLGLLDCQKIVTSTDILEKKDITPAQTITPETRCEEDIKTDYVKIPLRWVRYAAVACVAVLVSMLIPIPANTIIETFKAGQIDSSLLYRILPKATTESEQIPLVNTPKETISLKSATIKKDTVTILPVADTEVIAKPATEETVPHFSIVLASRVSLKNAENYIERITKAGHTEGRIVEMKQGYRVLYGRYTTEDEAQAKRRTLGKNELFDGCWVMKIVD